MLRENAIIPVRRTLLIYSEEPHPFHAGNKEAARRNWEDEIRRQPFLFDGDVVLGSSASAKDKCFTATCHLIPYSTFLLWRRRRPVVGAIHIFAMPLLVSSDDAVIAVRMGERTANAGRIYCASGSFDGSDLQAGRFDTEANMCREVMEETGLDLSQAAADPQGFHILPTGGVIVIFRVFRFEEDARTLAARIAAHVGGDPDPEIDGAEIVRGPDDVTAAFSFHMPPIIDWYFGTGRHRVASQ